MASNTTTPKPSLASAIEKVNRAGVHLKTLDREVRRFLRKKPHAYAHRIDSHLTHREELLVAIPGIPGEDEGPTREIRFPYEVTDKFWIRAHINRRHPATRWGAIIGDATHDLRSALDNLAWELACKKSGPPPSPPYPKKGPLSDWRYVAFPICLTEAEWTSDTTKRRLALLDPGLVSRFQKEQPYFRRHDRSGKAVVRKHPERHPLARLDELWNRDKHRSVSVVGSRMAFSNFPPAPKDWPYEPLQFTVLWQRPLGPFENDTKLALVEITGKTKARPVVLNRYLDYELGLTYDIGFEEGFPGYGKPIVETLRMLQNRVTAILVNFKSEFR